MDLLISSRRMKREYFETGHNSFHILLYLLLYHPVEEYYSERDNEEETIQNQVESDTGRKKKTKNVRQVNDFCIYNNIHITT